MKIIEMALREQEIHYYNPATKQMSLNMAKPIVKILSDSNPCDIYIVLNLNISKRDSDPNNLENLIASFKLAYQFRVEKDLSEEFSESYFDELILPFVYEKFNKMITEIGLPVLPLSAFEAVARKACVIS